LRRAVLAIAVIIAAACGVLTALATSSPWRGVLAGCLAGAQITVAGSLVTDAVAEGKRSRNVEAARRSLAPTPAGPALPAPGAVHPGPAPVPGQAAESARPGARRPVEAFRWGEAHRGGRALPDVYDDLVRRVLAEPPGRLLFNPPDRMQLGQTERVEVRVIRSLDLDAELLEGLRGHGEPRMEEIPTAPLMAVTLRGDGFRITSYSDEEQGVSKDAPTKWEFDIRAEKRGQQRLVLSVSLQVLVPGWPSQRRSIPVREVTIDVQVGTPALVGHFVSANWQWFVGTAIAIAAVVVAALIH
jgi:hypothetical protein